MELIRHLVSVKLAHLCEAKIISFGVPMKEHCSFRIGGPAEVFCEPNSQAQLIELLSFCLKEKVPYFILGKGSNLLISDKGILGMVISTSAFTKITRDENFVSAYSGVLLKDLCEFAQKEGLAGLEFAHGIPGSVGGAVFMNAGAYGGEIKDLLYCSKCLIPKQEDLESSTPVTHLKAEEHEFSYRHSALQDKGLIHLSSVFRLNPDNPVAIQARMDDFHLQRWDKQPMDLPSAGSVFKRPEGFYTGKLVDDCGLRGYRIGDAAVSDKHCGFIVNKGNATFAEVNQLIEHIQNTVYARYKVRLETEIRILTNEKT